MLYNMLPVFTIILPEISITFFLFALLLFRQQMK